MNEAQTITAAEATEEKIKPKLSSLERLIGVVVSPSETFQDIKLKPDFILPILLAMVVSIIANVVVMNRIKPNWENITRQSVNQSLERQGKTLSDLPENQRNAIEGQIKMSAKVSPYIPYIFIALTPVVIALLTLLFWGGTLIMGGTTSYKRVFSLTTYLYCVIFICAQTILNTIVLFLRDPNDIDLLKGGIAVTNPGMLMSSTSSPALISLLSRFDIFSIWFLILLIMGLSAVSDNVKIGKAGGIILSLWFVWIILTVSLSALFS